MNSLFDWLAKVVSSWRFWVVIPPWDVGVRIRLGKNAVALEPGLHLRLPFIDVITLVNTRLRVIASPVSVVGSSGSRCRVRRANAGIRVVNPVLAMMAYSDPSAVVAARLQAEAMNSETTEECLRALRAHFDPQLVVVEFVNFTESAEARMFRIVDEGWAVNMGDGLDAGERY